MDGVRVAQVLQSITVVSQSTALMRFSGGHRGDFERRIRAFQVAGRPRGLRQKKLRRVILQDSALEIYFILDPEY